MSRVFTLSDAHAWHELVAKLRDYASAEEHFAALDDGVRSTLTKRDTMIWLGDMTAGGKIPQMLDWVASLPGTHHLVAGNHCPVHPMFGGHARQREYLRAFASVSTIAQRKLGGRKVLMSHFPVVGDHKDRPHLDMWRPRPFAGVLLHGHTHAAEKISTAGETLQIHVGIDAWGMAPVSDEQLLALLEDEATPRPDCFCHACAAFEVNRQSWFRVCDQCGSKRCPRVADHREACEPVGS